MKRWEQFNQMTNTNENLKEQALKMFVGEILARYELAQVTTTIMDICNEINCEMLFDKMVDWLNEGVEE